MGILNDLGQKIKGKGQKVKGQIQIENNQPLRGSIEKLKGEVNDRVSDIKINSQIKRKKRNY